MGLESGKRSKGLVGTQHVIEVPLVNIQSSFRVHLSLFSARMDYPASPASLSDNGLDELDHDAGIFMERSYNPQEQYYQARLARKLCSYRLCSLHRRVLIRPLFNPDTNMPTEMQALRPRIAALDLTNETGQFSTQTLTVFPNVFTVVCHPKSHQQPLKTQQYQHRCNLRLSMRAHAAIFLWSLTYLHKGRYHNMNLMSR